MKEKLLSWLKQAAEAVRILGRAVPTVLVALGVAASAAGVGMIYRPAGVIAAGIMLIAAGIIMMSGGEGQ